MRATDKAQSASRMSSLPAHGWLGLGLVIVFWVLNWSLTGPRTHWGFFPLWLGYSLIVDAWVHARKGRSLLTRSPGAFVCQFLVSAPTWWLFELINLRTQNWYYQGRQLFSDVQYVAWASLSFSTVMPAVFGTAELVSTFEPIKYLRRGPVIAPTRATSGALLVTGWLMLAMLLAWPRYFFPLVWISLYCIIEPLNVWLGSRSLLQCTAKGDWRVVLSLWVGCLICGFLWELWNYYSYPRWVYQVPFFDFWRVFEMPLLGYGGHIPFSLELFALYHLALGVLKRFGASPTFAILPAEAERYGMCHGQACSVSTGVQTREPRRWH